MFLVSIISINLFILIPYYIWIVGYDFGLIHKNKDKLIYLLKIITAISFFYTIEKERAFILLSSLLAFDFGIKLFEYLL